MSLILSWQAQISTPCISWGQYIQYLFCQLDFHFCYHVLIAFEYMFFLYSEWNRVGFGARISSWCLILANNLDTKLKPNPLGNILHISWHSLIFSMFLTFHINSFTCYFWLNMEFGIWRYLCIFFTWNFNSINDNSSNI